MPADECSTSATQHLRECGECREFHQQQTKLRQIVGSLGTVQAPPDFDFRLRARLANESSSAGFHLRSMHWSFATRGFAAAAMVVLFVGGVVYVRTIINQPAAPALAEQRTKPVQQPPNPPEQRTVVPDQTPVIASDHGPRRVRSERRVTPRTKPSLVAADFAVQRPIVISSSQLQSPIFPIDASFESFRVSLEDGRGNERTISVPTITFGSQRVLPVAHQFGQKGVW
jgi:hypothetical protein